MKSCQRIQRILRFKSCYFLLSQPTATTGLRLKFISLILLVFFFFFLFSFFLFLIHASYKREFTLSISVNSRFRLYRKFPHLSITNSVTRQGGSINIIQVTVYSFTVPALKLMKVKFCLFFATTAHCHDRAAIKIHITHFTRILMITLT